MSPRSVPNSAPSRLEPGPWHARAVEEVLASLEASAEGLATTEATRRLQAHGLNQLPRPRDEGPWPMLWRQIHNPLIYVLLGSAALALLMGKPTDAGVVLGRRS